MFDNNEIHENEPSEDKSVKQITNLRLNTIEENNIGRVQKNRKLKRLKKDKNKKSERTEKKNPYWITQV